MTLPFDYHRCRPMEPDSNCKRCLRWSELPDQTWGDRTPVACGRDNSTSEDCSFIDAKQK